MKADQKWMWKFAFICALPITGLDMLFPGHIELLAGVVILLGCGAAVYSIQRWP